MQFSPDSALLLLGGESNNFCMYSVADRMLLKKFTITENRSLDGVVVGVLVYVILYASVAKLSSFSSLRTPTSAIELE